MFSDCRRYNSQKFPTLSWVLYHHTFHVLFNHTHRTYTYPTHERFKYVHSNDAIKMFLNHTHRTYMYPTHVLEVLFEDTFTPLATDMELVVDEILMLKNNFKKSFVLPGEIGEIFCLGGKVLL